MATMKAMLEKLTKESIEKEARMKLQEQKIARLSRKLEATSSILLKKLRN